MSKNSPLLRTMGRTTALAAILVLTFGCSLHRARKAYDEERYDEAVKAFRDILQNAPDNVSAKIGYRRAATKAAEIHLVKAKDAQKRGLDEQEYLEVRKAVVLDPSNAVAVDWITNLEAAAQRKRLQQEAEEDFEAQRKSADFSAQATLNPRSLEGMDLNFSRRQSLREIFAQLTKATGVNIILHSSFQDVSISADLRGLNFQRILDTLMLQNELFYKMLDRNTIMIFKNTPPNREQFENQCYKTFYLSNADPNDVRQVLQQLMPQQMKIMPDKRMNAVTIKGKSHDLAVAQRLVNQLDKAKAEVMVYLELMEVTQNSAEQVGLLPVLGATDTSGVYRLGATIDNTGAANQNKGAIRISKSDIRFLFPSLALDALKSSGDAKLVASPNLRVVSGEKGDINIGEKISTTQSSMGYGSATGTTSSTTSSAINSYLGGTSQTQYSYEDVGVHITLEPRVHFNGDITIKIKSEVKTLKSGSTAGRPDLGQRIIETTARLRDGETAVFAGLLKEEEQKSLQGIWGVSDIPLIGKLLGSNSSKKAKTDVLLTIRAVQVRKPDIQPEDWEAFDPDLAASKVGPFTPKPEPKKAPVVAKAAPSEARPAPSEAKAPPSETRPIPAPKPEAKPTTQDSVPVPVPVPTPTSTEATPPAKGEAEPQDATEDSLVIFLAPITSQLPKGQRLRLDLLVSSGKGLTSGTMELRIDPKLKLVSMVAGDFLTAESGTLDPNPPKDGILRLAFKRTGTASDSGTLATLELEGTATGNAPVLIQSGSYMIGRNPVSARVVNALVTVE